MSKELTLKRQLLKQLINNLNLSSTNYAILSGFDENYNFNGRDLDILCEKRDINFITNFIIELFSKNHFIVKFQKKNRLTSIFAIQRDLNINSAIQIDLIFRISLKDKIFFDNNSIFLKDDLILINNFKFAPFYFFIKNILMQISIGDFNKADSAVNSFYFYFVLSYKSKIISKLINFNFAKAEYIFNLIERKKYSETQLEINQALKFRISKILFRPLFHIKLFANAFLFYVVNYFKFANAPFIAIVGPDGCGKSFIIKKIISKNSDANGFLKFNSFHLRPNLFPTLSKLILNKNESNFQVSPRDKPGPFFLFRLFYYSLDYILGYLFIIKKILAKNFCVVFDRYFLDLYVHPARIGLSSNKFVLLIWKIIPKPQVIYAIEENPELIYNRKQELSLKEISKQYEEWRKLQKKISIIHFTKNDDQAVDNILKDIYGKFFQ